MVFEEVVPGFKCSNCDTVSTQRHVIERHIRERKHCANAIVKDCQAVFTCQDDTDTPPSSPVKRMKPGPKRLDVASILQTRLPWGDWDERIEYMFENVPPATLEHHFKTGTPHSSMIWALKTLWCGEGPATFQSFIAVGHTTHELTRETPDDEVSRSYIERHTKKKQLAKDVATWLTEFMILICEDPRYIPHYRPDLVPYATTIHNWLIARDNGVTLLDVMHRTKTYDLVRKKLSDEFKNEADRIIHDIRKTLEHSTMV